MNKLNAHEWELDNHKERIRELESEIEKTKKESSIDKLYPRQ
jgi:hypothetical protein